MSGRDKRGAGVLTKYPLEQSSTAATIPSTISSIFLEIPADLHYLLTSLYLPWDSVLALRLTCKYFSTLLPLDKIRDIHGRLASHLFRKEKWLRRHWMLPIEMIKSSSDYDFSEQALSCYSCMRSLPPSDFLHCQVTEDTSLGAKCADQRWCKSCGLRMGLARPGSWYRGYSSLFDPVRHGCYQNIKTSCMLCFCELSITYWGCVDCFAKVEQRWREEDKEAMPKGFGFALAVGEKWRSFKFIVKRTRTAGRQLGSSRHQMEGGRDGEELVPQIDGNHGTITDQLHQSRNKRRQIRCYSCWWSNTRRRRYRSLWASVVLGEMELWRGAWCEACLEDEVYFAQKTLNSKHNPRAEAAVCDLPI